MKNLVIALLALWSIPSFAMNFGAFAVHCQTEREVIKSIDKTLESGNLSDTTKEAYFEHIIRAISKAQKCSEIDDTLRDILGDLPADGSTGDRFSREWEETKSSVKARNEYNELLRGRNGANRFEEEFKKF